ncbi:hypothetical protein M0R88_05700 [Halorussus gelatinilyticus]|uniref:Uncharacterized protein n=1 Tax=Halorussus gelatinilyticus TaxID=2937524 RepID=A0A8U0IKC7_9EURY|nr:hypothetical protein [Halorussus gelatinilyticus]UPW01597.1 hypothetical protein M0R88_05700 [Halorussus gelatinilyticus]
MVSKRRLGASLLLLGLAFVGAFHAVLAVAYDTGLASVGAGLAGISVLSLMVVNLPALGEGDSSGGDDDSTAEK